MHTSLPSPTPHPFPALPHSRPRSPSFPVSSPLILGPLYLQIISMRARAGNERRRRDDTRTARCFTYWSSFFVPPIALLPNSQCPPGFCMDPASVRTGESAGGRDGRGGVLDIESGERSFVCLGRCSFLPPEQILHDRATYPLACIVRVSGVRNPP